MSARSSSPGLCGVDTLQTLDLDGGRTITLPRALVAVALSAETCERDPWETALAPARVGPHDAASQP